MPYSMKNIPSAVKNLSKAIQKIYIATFNAVYDETKDETAARQAAWSNVKQKYTKEGDKWVKKQSESIEEPESEVENETEEETEDTEPDEQEESIKDEITFGSPLLEAVFDDESKTAIVTIIREGWSANYTDGRQRYYTSKAVSDVAELLNTSRKMFIDHSAKERSVSEWTATVKKSWTESISGKNHCKAEVDFTENPKTVWLYTEAKKHPQEVALSIQGAGEIRSGKKEDKNASIVESITKLRSTDFVTVAAAGGKVEKTLAASADTERALFVLNEAFLTLDQIIDKMEKEEQPFIDYDRMLSALREFISNLIWTSEVTDGDVIPSIEDALNNFGNKIKDVVQKIRDNKKSDDSDGNEEEEETDESVENKEIPIMTLEELKTSQPEAYDALVSEAKELVSKEVREAVEADKATLVTEKEEIEKRLQEAEVELGKFKTEKALAEKKERIEAKLAEFKISEKVSEEFKGLLLTLEEEVADKLVADKAETLAFKAVKVEGFGPADKKENKEPKVENFKSLWFKN